MKITKEKQTKLIGVAMATVVVIGGLWYLLINSQSAILADVSRKIETGKDNELRILNAVKVADKIQVELDAANGQMSQIAEGEMASGDLYSWMYNTIKGFKVGYRVDIPQFSSVEQSDCTLIPKFQFKQVKMTIGGSGYYHDIGKFIADFENHYPHIRLQNLQLSPAIGAQSASDREKVAFHVEVVALVKSSNETK